MDEVVIEEDLGNMDYVKLSSTQYLFLKPRYVKIGMFPVHQIQKHVHPFFDLHATCQHTSVINDLEDDNDLGFYGNIGYVELGDNRKASILVVQTTLRQYKTKCSLQLVLFKKKSMKKKLNNSDHIVTTSLIVDGSVDCLKLFIFNTTQFVIPGNKGRYPPEIIEHRWNELFLSTRQILTDGKILSRSMKRKHVTIFSEKNARKLTEAGTLETISYRETNRSDVKRLYTLKTEATTISYSDIASSKQSGKRTMNLREEALSLVPGIFEKRRTPEAWIKGFMLLKEMGLGQDQLAATAATMLMDSSYRITDATPIEEDVIEDVSIDIDQVRCQFMNLLIVITLCLLIW